MNGDTYFDVDVNELYRAHVGFGASVTCSAKRLEHARRYGILTICEDRIIEFRPPGDPPPGSYINGGVYAVTSNLFAATNLPEQFSFENFFLAKQTDMLPIYAFAADGFFLDIGIPEDYTAAQQMIPPAAQLAGQK